jgi:hypothetical protein
MITYKSNILDNINSIGSISEYISNTENVLSFGWRSDDDEPPLLKMTKFVGS